MTITHYDFVGRPFALQNPGSLAAPTASAKYQLFSTYLEYEASRVSDIYDSGKLLFSPPANDVNGVPVVTDDGLHTRLYHNGMGQLLVRNLETSALTVPTLAGFVGATREVLNRDALGIVTNSYSYKDNGSEG